VSDQEPRNGSEIAIYESQRAEEVELVKATGAFEQAVLSPLFLLNGGATVAFLTLLGAASAEDSRLDISPVLSGLATMAWSFGLLSATWAVRKGYESQRKFTQAVRLRRQLMERALIGENSKIREVLTPLPSERDRNNSNDPQKVIDEARATQKWYLRLSTLASVWFVVGVCFAAVAVLL
jgi:hypothetical protein